MFRSPPTNLSDLLEQRDDELVDRIERGLQDATHLAADLQAGNVEAARYMLAALRSELEKMRELLP